MKSVKVIMALVAEYGSGCLYRDPDVHDRYDAVKSAVEELIAENKNLYAYSMHERSLGAEKFAMENQSLIWQVEDLTKELEVQKQFRALAVDHANIQANEALRYQKTIHDLQEELAALKEKL